MRFAIFQFVAPQEKFGFNKTTVATFIRDRVKAGGYPLMLWVVTVQNLQISSVYSKHIQIILILCDA